VHGETIAVGVAEPGGEVRSLGVVPNRPESVRKLVKSWGQPLAAGLLRGRTCGYVLYWQLTQMGVHCDVVAPTLVPIKSGERVKTTAAMPEAGAQLPQRRPDAVWVPDRDHEALRDLVRAREAAKKDQLRAATACRSSC